ncbi:hypothetical protein BU26DRAFT_560429 [Trematosphaeria pertusa]|uniref:Uncharacterized protein n=1 Tax=Trematosphaeria pertusa TaxID=390896 RepID=A0A6A6ISK2_9PLEO|nr:uncharacterized protein BU26DRAFT_560429 [Trematosphaeria pertusa]KAF2253088.1 hypothetical protein BU26DRAFT_560429 [Trematosphaeria pertusa]
MITGKSDDQGKHPCPLYNHYSNVTLICNPLGLSNYVHSIPALAIEPVKSTNNGVIESATEPHTHYFKEEAAVSHATDEINETKESKNKEEDNTKRKIPLHVMSNRLQRRMISMGWSPTRMTGRTACRGEVSEDDPLEPTEEATLEAEEGAFEQPFIDWGSEEKKAQKKYHDG